MGVEERGRGSHFGCEGGETSKGRKGRRTGKWRAVTKGGNWSGTFNHFEERRGDGVGVSGEQTSGAKKTGNQRDERGATKTAQEGTEMRENGGR